MPYLQTGPGDQKIFYIDRGDSKEIIVFIHGWYQNARDSFGPYIDRLHHEYRVIAPDLPGHGSSSKATDGEYTLDSAYRAVELLLKHIEEDAHQITLVGFSMGAYLSFRAAMKHSEKIASIIAVSPILDFGPYEQRLKRIQKLPLTLFAMYLRMNAWLNRFPFGDRTRIYQPEKGHRIPTRNQYFKIKTRNHPAHAAQSYMKSFMGSSIDSLVHNVHEPVLLIYGENDSLTPVEYGSSIASRIPRGVLKVIRGAGHNVQLVRQEETLSYMTQFLDEHRKRKFTWRRLFRR